MQTDAIPRQLSKYLFYRRWINTKFFPIEIFSRKCLGVSEPNFPSRVFLILAELRQSLTSFFVTDENVSISLFKKSGLVSVNSFEKYLSQASNVMGDKISFDFSYRRCFKFLRSQYFYLVQNNRVQVFFPCFALLLSNNFSLSLIRYSLIVLFCMRKLCVLLCFLL